MRRDVENCHFWRSMPNSKFHRQIGLNMPNCQTKIFTDKGLWKLPNLSCLAAKNANWKPYHNVMYNRSLHESVRTRNCTELSGRSLHNISIWVTYDPYVSAGKFSPESKWTQVAYTSASVWRLYACVKSDDQSVTMLMSWRSVTTCWASEFDAASVARCLSSTCFGRLRRCCFLVGTSTVPTSFRAAVGRPSPPWSSRLVVVGDHGSSSCRLVDGRVRFPGWRLADVLHLSAAEACWTRSPSVDADDAMTTRVTDPYASLWPPTE